MYKKALLYKCLSYSFKKVPNKKTNKRNRELQCRHLIPALNAWPARAWYTTTCSIATQFSGHGWTLYNQSYFDVQATWVIDVFDWLFDIIDMCVCTTRHWQTSGRLVQELNVCTVYYYRYGVRVNVGLPDLDFLWSLRWLDRIPHAHSTRTPRARPASSWW